MWPPSSRQFFRLCRRIVLEVITNVLAYGLHLHGRRMEAIYSSETLVNTYKTTRHLPEDDGGDTFLRNGNKIRMVYSGVH
jgi:hypothetical protein